MNTKEFVKKFGLKELVDKAEMIYEKNKSKLETNDKGKYLAIVPESGDIYLGGCFFEALRMVSKEHRNTLLYIVKIGSNRISIDLFAQLTSEK